MAKLISIARQILWVKLHLYCHSHSVPGQGGILMKSQDQNEELLTDGNVSNVFSSGETIRRELKSDSKKK
jgi:hypothetical protein